jgi:hypothetical protein
MGVVSVRSEKLEVRSDKTGRCITGRLKGSSHKDFRMIGLEGKKSA